MKGLLIKDAYMTVKYCKSLLLICIIFFIAQYFTENMFFCIYISVVTGIIPVTLLGYDERSKWSEYTSVLPYSKAQIVSSKYIIGLVIQIIVFLFSCISLTVTMSVRGNFSIAVLTSTAQIVLILSLLSSALTLPFIFKFGMEKGRIAYYIMIGVICAISTFTSMSAFDGSIFETKLNSLLPFILIGIIIIYSLSWILSVKFYKSR